MFLTMVYYFGNYIMNICMQISVNLFKTYLYLCKTFFFIYTGVSFVPISLGTICFLDFRLYYTSSSCKQYRTITFSSQLTDFFFFWNNCPEKSPKQLPFAAAIFITNNKYAMVYQLVLKLFFLYYQREYFLSYLTIS